LNRGRRVGQKDLEEVTGRKKNERKWCQRKIERKRI
jgi:hypothetical protein